MTSDRRYYIDRQSARFGILAALCLGFGVGIAWAGRWQIAGWMFLCTIYGLSRAYSADVQELNPQTDTEADSETDTEHDDAAMAEG